jgi:hypothetical protein
MALTTMLVLNLQIDMRIMLEFAVQYLKFMHFPTMVRISSIYLGSGHPNSSAPH